MKTIQLTDKRVITLQFCVLTLQMLKTPPVFTDKELLDEHTSVLEEMIKEYENPTNKGTKPTSD